MSGTVDFARIVRQGDLVLCGQGCAEPTTLLEMLVAQGDGIGPFRLFLGASFSGTVKADTLPGSRILTYGAIGTGELSRAGRLEVCPDHYSMIGQRLADGRMRADVVLLQVAPPDSEGRFSLGMGPDFAMEAARHAREVVLEVNAQVPRSLGTYLPDDLPITAMIHTDRCPVEPPPTGAPNETMQRIARHVAGLVADGATIEIGVGSIADAILETLRDHRDLGIHSGMLSDSMVDLIERGVVTNARKPIDTGKSVATICNGSRRTRDFVHENPAVALLPTTYTHNPAVLHGLGNLHAINFAIELDVTGQVNAEALAGSYVGAIGGHSDFSRAAHRLAGGRAIVALAATGAKGAVSRIVPALAGPVSTARSDVDFVVTEWGVAELSGRTLRERMQAMIAIAHPDHREHLARASGDN